MVELSFGVAAASRGNQLFLSKYLLIYSLQKTLTSGGTRCGVCEMGQYCLEVRDEQELREGTCMSREFIILLFNYIICLMINSARAIES